MGHYGCNSNGEHERCGSDSCGMYETCPNKGLYYFKDRDDAVLDNTTKAEALKCINVITEELEKLKELLEMR